MIIHRGKLMSQPDPFEILGLEPTASEAEVRESYLRLVKLHPPETDPERFREIHDAYTAAKDPLVLADRLLSPYSRVPDWDEVIEEQKKRPPALNPKLLLALGNQPEKTAIAATTTDNSEPPAPPAAS